MRTNNNLNILPFYDSLEEQNHKKSYAYNSIYTLIAEDSKLLPFQINRPHLGLPVNKLLLWNLDTGTSVNILSEATASGLNVKQFAGEGYDLIISPSLLIFPTLVMQPGQYYLELGDTDKTWYSEVFTVVTNLSQFLKIEYSDNAAIQYTGGHIDYSDQYRNFLYVQSEIGKPDYNFEEEAQKRDGYTFIEKQISEKKYKFEFLAPEFLCDALRIVRMHDFIKIYYQGKTYDVENIIFEPKWKEQGDLAIMEVEFECDTIIKKIGRGYVPGSTDFNNDFNNDYKL